MSTNPPEGHCLRPVDVARMIGVNRSTITRWLAKGYLPKPIQYTPSFCAWRKSTIEEWIAKKELAAQS